MLCDPIFVAHVETNAYNYQSRLFSHLAVGFWVGTYIVEPETPAL